MDKKEKIKKQRLLRRLMSSLFIAGATATAAIMILPNKPVANIINLQSDYTMIFYEISLEDNDNLIIDEYMKVILKDEQDNEVATNNLELGENQGYFENLYIGFVGSIEVVVKLESGNEILVEQNVVIEEPHWQEDYEYMW